LPACGPRGLLIVFFRDDRSVPPEKLTLDRIDATAIAGFLDWLETGRHNSVSTRNQRLAAISSFYRWVQSQDPAQMACCQDVLAIPAKKQAHPAVNHLSVEQTRRLLAQPDRSTRPGCRDATLLATLYDTAARAQELADLTVADIRLGPPAMAVLTGKGGKTRHVPLGDNTAALLNAYLAERRLNGPAHNDPVFVNQQSRKLSRGGIAWIIRKYQAMTGDPVLANAELSPHVLRHSRAMHLYEAVPCPTSGTSSAMSTFLLPRSTHVPPPKPSAEPSKPPTSTSSPTTCPNGTKIPACSTGLPRSEAPHRRVMRSARPQIPPSPGPTGQRCA
jgi:site-specific recombinase XerD